MCALGVRVVSLLRRGTTNCYGVCAPRARRAAPRAAVTRAMREEHTMGYGATGYGLLVAVVVVVVFDARSAGLWVSGEH